VFSGIVEATGQVESSLPSEGGRLRILNAPFSGELVLGESVSINGACMTVVESGMGSFSVDVSRETLRVTRMGEFKPGERVNLERAMTLSDRLGGHLVLGHVDCLGKILERALVGNTVFFRISVPAPHHRYLIPKGSVTVDGISLTVNSLEDLSDRSGSIMDLAIIPHTILVTTLGDRIVGDTVQLELDMVGKYVDRFRQVDGAGGGVVGV
jgi:riboflavin synthase